MGSTSIGSGGEPDRNENQPTPAGGGSAMAKSGASPRGKGSPADDPRSQGV